MSATASRIHRFCRSIHVLTFAVLGLLLLALWKNNNDTSGNQDGLIHSREGTNKLLDASKEEQLKQHTEASEENVENDEQAEPKKSISRLVSIPSCDGISPVSSLKPVVATTLRTAE